LQNKAFTSSGVVLSANFAAVQNENVAIKETSDSKNHTNTASPQKEKEQDIRDWKFLLKVPVSLKSCS